MFKRIVIIAITSLPLFSCNNNEEEEYIPLLDISERLYAGGETTIFSETSIAYSSPASNLFGNDLNNHFVGDALFEQAFVTAPSQVNGGIGPIFNNTSCISCHPKDGRASFPSSLNSLSGFFLRTSIPGTNQFGGDIPTPGFGTQIQNQAIFGYQPEAKFQVAFSDIIETLADGTQIVLKKPTYSIVNSYIPLPANAMLSPRIAPPVFGLGLLEEIPDANLIAFQDINDTNNDGISGKLNYVHDAVSGLTKIGRFGWKGNTATVFEQCAGAYNGDMGITNALFNIETGFGQTNGSDGLADDPEVSQQTLENITLYIKTLAVPAPRNISNTNVRKGAQLFEQLECAKCHVPKQQTGFSTITSLSHQTFYPYTDLLLHDMGNELADNRPDYLANGNEWKTRPLWGIGLSQVVNGHTQFLHDGRAKNITEAILWHGGEAQNSKNKFKQLSSNDRNNLLIFINSL